MSNLACIGICILICLVTSACFMSVYKEDFKIEYNSDKNFIYSCIRNLTEENNTLRARVYDLETKLKEMETTDNGK